jgi:hypothetical protein
VNTVTPGAYPSAVFARNPAGAGPTIIGVATPTTIVTSRTYNTLEGDQMRETAVIAINQDTLTRLGTLAASLAPA